MGLRSFQKPEFKKSIIFIFPEKKNTSNFNLGLILMLLLIFVNKIKIEVNFQKKNLKKWALNHVV
jgi:hypothetical protein